MQLESGMSRLYFESATQCCAKRLYNLLGPALATARDGSTLKGSPKVGHSLRIGASHPNLPYDYYARTEWQSSALQVCN